MARSPNSRFGASRFNASSEINHGRKVNTREERKVKDDLPKMVFSFKDVDFNQVPPGQTYKEWLSDGLLNYMLDKFQYICQNNIVEAQQQGMLKIYKDFPVSSEFKRPKHIIAEANWAVIMDIKGQKPRVAGHIIGNVFYVVFLDKNHVFFPSVKKNT